MWEAQNLPTPPAAASAAALNSDVFGTCRRPCLLLPRQQKWRHESYLWKTSGRPLICAPQNTDMHSTELQKDGAQLHCDWLSSVLHAEVTLVRLCALQDMLADELEFPFAF